MTIDFAANKKKLFNKSFYEIRKAKTRYVVVYGSAASGKSVSAHQSEIINLLNADYDILFVRKFAADLKDSCYSLLQQQAKRFGIYDLFNWRFSNALREVENKITGHKILLKGIDDPDKLKSIVGIKRVVIEEADKLNFEDFLELDRRARGMEGIQIIVIYNPISEKHWIKTTLRNPEHVYYPDTTILKYTYHDNKFVTEQDKKTLENLRLISENHYRIYALGEDGIEDKQMKFAWAFDESKHTAPTDLHPEPPTFNPDEVLWLSFDFNVNPMTCGAFQYYGDVLYGLKCWKLENSNTWEMCARIKAEYPNALYLVTGDASGENLNAAFRDEMHNYRIIMQELGINSQQLRVPTRNPSIDTNQILVNAVLLNTEVILHKVYCEPLIFDLNYVEVDQKKDIIKDRSTDKKKADFLDLFRYLCNQLYDITMLKR